jgi:hypothetical protein
MTLDFIETLKEWYTDKEIEEMNAFEANDAYIEIKSVKDAPRDPEERHWDNLATFNERFSGDYHD